MGDERASGPAGAPRRLLFVCIANITRSPYAERRAARLLSVAAPGAWSVASAGIPGYPGRPMDALMAAELQRREIDPSGHRSRVLDAHLAGGAAVILTMAAGHRFAILDAFPEAARRVFGLRQFVRALSGAPESLRGDRLIEAVAELVEPASVVWDVEDPHGRGRRAARSCAAEIDDLLEVVVSRLADAAPSAPS